MAITIIEASEIVSGLTITGKISPNAVRTDILFSPYDELVKLYKSGVTEPEELIERVGLNTVQASLESIKNLNGLSSADWLSILDNTAMKYNMGMRMEKIGKKLQKGDDIDPTEIRHVANQFGKGKTGRISLLEAEKLGTEVPFIETGFKSIDTHLGGVPSAGLIVVGGDSAVGKSWFMVNVTSSFVKKNPKKCVGVYSIEMQLPEVAGRFVTATTLQDTQKSRIEINTEALTADEIIADASGMDDLGIIFIDFADMLVKGEVTESKMSEIYLAFAIGAKQLGIPIVLFCQFNKSYQGGLPRPTHIRWTSMAEKLAWMILMLYRPAEDYHAEKDADKLPIISDIGYILAWKIRGGFRQHRGESPGAIQLPFDGEKGWSHGSGKWFSLKNA